MLIHAVRCGTIRNRIRDREVLIKTVSYFAVLCLVLIVLFFLYFSRLILPKYNEQILSETQLSCDIIEQSLRSTVINPINDINSDIFSGTDEARQISVLAGMQTVSTRQAIDVLSFFRERQKRTPIFYTIDIYFENSDTVVSTQYGLTVCGKDPAAEKKYHLWLDRGLLDFGNAGSLRLSQYTVNAAYSGTDLITFSKPLLLSSNGRVSRCIVNYGIRRDVLAQLLNIDSSDFEGSIIVSNQYGNIASLAGMPASVLAKTESDWGAERNTKEFRIGNDTFISCPSANDSNLRVIKLVPMTDISKSSHDMYHIFLVFLVLILIFSLFVGGFASFTLYSPLRDLIRQIGPGRGEKDAKRDPAPHRNEYSRIFTAFQSLSAQVNLLEGTLEKNRALAVANLLKALLNGSIRSPEEYDGGGNLYGDLFPHPFFIVAEVHLQPEQLEENHFRLLKRNMLDEIARLSGGHCAYYAVETDRNTLTVLVNCDFGSTSAALDCSIFSEGEVFRRPEAVLCIGGAKDSLQEIRISKDEAEEAFRYSYLLPQQKVFLYEFLKLGNRRNELPQKLADKWEDSLRAGDIPELTGLLLDIADELKNGEYDAVFVKSVMEKMLADFRNRIDQYYVRNNISPPRTFEMPKAEPRNIEEAAGLARELFSGWRSRCESVRENKKYAIVQAAIGYIGGHLDRPLTLDEVSQQIYISPAYLSKIFREITGKKFSEFVCAAKMESARKALLEGSESIENIASGLGFASSNYFIKRFKQFYGITPNLYRSNQHIRAVETEEGAGKLPEN